MNILLLVHSLADPGGTQRFVYELGKLLAERHKVFECSFDAFREPHVFRSENEVLSLGVKAPKNLAQRLIGYAQKAYRLNRIKKRYSIDVTISNLWPADFINYLSMGPGKKVSNGLVNIVGNRQNKIMLKFRKLFGIVYRSFDRVVAINRDLTDEWIQLFELSPSRTATIYAFLSLKDTSTLESVYSKDLKRIVWLGRLHRMKNLKPLFAIWTKVKEKLADIQLIVIGEGPDHRELVSAARATGLSVTDQENVTSADVVFLGFVANPYQYLKGCSAFALTSKSEGFGLVIVEAMSVGLPVLASDCPTGGPHLILGGSRPYQHGRTLMEETPYGYLLPIPTVNSSSTSEIWGDAIVEILSNENKRNAMSDRCKCRATDFSTEKIRNQWFDVIDSL